MLWKCNIQVWVGHLGDCNLGMLCRKRLPTSKKKILLNLNQIQDYSTLTFCYYFYTIPKESQPNVPDWVKIRQVHSAKKNKKTLSKYVPQNRSEKSPINLFAAYWRLSQWSRAHLAQQVIPQCVLVRWDKNSSPVKWPSAAITVACHHRSM